MNPLIFFLTSTKEKKDVHLISCLGLKKKTRTFLSCLPSAPYECVSWIEFDICMNDNQIFNDQICVLPNPSRILQLVHNHSQQRTPKSREHHSASNLSRGVNHSVLPADLLSIIPAVAQAARGEWKQKFFSVWKKRLACNPALIGRAQNSSVVLLAIVSMQGV